MVVVIITSQRRDSSEVLYRVMDPHGEEVVDRQLNVLCESKSQVKLRNVGTFVTEIT